MEIKTGTQFRTWAGYIYTVSTVLHVYPSGLIDFICYAVTDPNHLYPESMSSSDIKEILKEKK